MCMKRSQPKLNNREMEWSACTDEYEKLVRRMSTPRVVINNAVCPTATLVKVDSARNGSLV